MELFHETWVWLGEGAGLADEVEEGVGGDVGVFGEDGEEVGDDQGCGAGFAHCAGAN